MGERILIPIQASFSVNLFLNDNSGKSRSSLLWPEFLLTLLPISVFVKHNLHISCLTGSKLKKQLSVFFAFRLETNFVIFLAANERFNFADAVS